MWKWAVFFALLGLDFFSKKWALCSLPFVRWHEGYPFDGIGIFQLGKVSFSLNLVTNTGAAWGLFGNYPGFLFLIRIGLIVGLVVFLVFFNKNKKIPSLPMWLILVGAIGNGLDYCLYKCVIDFFHFTFWGYSFPIFNIADSCITLGALAIIFYKKPFSQFAICK